MSIKDAILEQLYPYQLPLQIRRATLTRLVLEQQPKTKQQNINIALQQLEDEKSIICQKIISANYNVSITSLGKKEIENHKFKSADKTISDTKSLTDVQKEQIKQLLKTLLEEMQKEKQNQNHKRILDIIKTIKEATGTIHDVTQIIDWIRQIIGA